MLYINVFKNTHQWLFPLFLLLNGEKRKRNYIAMKLVLPSTVYYDLTNQTWLKIIIIKKKTKFS